VKRSLENDILNVKKKRKLQINLYFAFSSRMLNICFLLWFTRIFRTETRTLDKRRGLREMRACVVNFPESAACEKQRCERVPRRYKDELKEPQTGELRIAASTVGFLFTRGTTVEQHLIALTSRRHKRSAFIVTRKFTSANEDVHHQARQYTPMTI